MNAPDKTPFEIEVEAMENKIRVVNGLDFVKSVGPTNWVYKGILIRSYLYAFVSPTNHGKTTIVATWIAMALMGKDFGGFKNVSGKPLRVLLLCGENDDDTGKKLIGAFKTFGVPDEQVKKNLSVVPMAFEMLRNAACMAEAANALGVDYDIVFVDTWQAYWSGGDFNNNDAQLEHARGLRYLTKAINGKPTVVVPAHPTKNATRENLVPYGGGSALNEVDTVLTGWRTGDVFELHIGKKRQQDFLPVSFVLEQRVLNEIVDNDGTPTDTVVAVHISDNVAEAKAISNLEIKEAALLAIYDLTQCGGRASRRKVTDRLVAGGFNVVENQVRKAIEDLERDGLVEEGKPTSKGIRESKKLERFDARNGR